MQDRAERNRLYTLYRFYAADDTLLYIGLTVNPGRRMEKHAYDKPWWADVARIAMEQHPNLDALRAAERHAIETEKPLHNIRMNGGTPGRETSAPTAPSEPTAIDGLVGRWFHTWREPRDDEPFEQLSRGGRVVQWQGEVLERVADDLYLVETYSWLDGSPYEQQIVSVHDMAAWTFYSSNVEMIASLGCGERRGDTACRAPAEYLTVNHGLGRTPVCGHCAGYYSSVQPIVWRDGRAQLGSATTIEHPLRSGR